VRVVELDCDTTATMMKRLIDLLGLDLLRAQR
jgi:hypothetical protein